jgi:hypothetical protein
MITDDDIATFMGHIQAEDKQAMEYVMESMSEGDRSYMKGYLAGYVEGVRQMQMAFSPDGTLKVSMNGASTQDGPSVESS